MHNVIIVAAILFAGVGGFFVGAGRALATVARMGTMMEQSARVMEGQNILILDLIALLDPEAAAKVRADMESRNA